MVSILKKINKKNKVLTIEDFKKYQNEARAIRIFVEAETKKSNPDYRTISKKMERFMKIEKILQRFLEEKRRNA